MKKVLTLIFVIALLISACGQSTPATVSAPEVTNTPANTSTPEATATAEVSATLEESPTQTPKTALLVSEFSPSCFGTETYSGDWGKMFTENGELHLATNPPSSLFVPCKEKEFSDFTFEADAALVDNGGASDNTTIGLIFRANPQQFYEFGIKPNGQAILYYAEKNNYKPLFDWTPIPSFKAGDIAHLKVMAIGDQISLYLNDQLIKSIQDTTLASGAVGFVINSNESTEQEAFFKNAKVTDEVANAPTNTSTSQESPNPEMQKSYAVISADKAEFWFPLPDREWQWFVLPKTDVVYEEYSWSVRFEVDKAYEIYVDITNNDNLLPQKGSAADMLKVAGVEISQLESMDSDCFSDLCYFTGFKNVSVTSIDGGLLIDLTEPSLVQALYQSKPETVRFGYSYLKDYTDPNAPKYEYGEFNVTPTYK